MAQEPPNRRWERGEQTPSAGSRRPPSQQTRGRPVGDEPLGLAHAPYNFVPLPALAAAWQAPPAADRYHPDRYTGHLDLEIVAETSLYIRGVAGLAQLDLESKELPAFYQPTGRPGIPGSSLRGMLRTLVEIISRSAVGEREVFDSHYAFRAVAERTQSSLTMVYRDRLGQVQAGYLRRVGGTLQIIQASRRAGEGYWQVEYEHVDQVFHTHCEAKPFQRHAIVFEPGAPPAAGRVGQVRNLAPWPGPQPPGWQRGWLVVSGSIERKRHAWIIAGPDEAAQPIELAEEDERIYRDGWSPALAELDKERQFPLLPRGGESLPCFFTFWHDEARRRHVALGHTRWFRLPYEHGVRSRIPVSATMQKEAWDLTRAVFGRAGRDVESWAGRIFVEDALLVGNPAAELLAQDLPRVLSTPKPTTFQHYLEQGRALATHQRSDLQHWDSPGAAIRGYKLHWHRPGATWQEPADSPRPRGGDSQGTPIQPIGPGSRFQGRVRFENLAAEELGAMLIACNLPPECRHRLGMGKPLGMGSVKITAELHLDRRRERYARLFAADAERRPRWAAPEEEEPAAAELEASFARWVLRVGGGGGPSSTMQREPPPKQADLSGGTLGADDSIAALWQQERMQALRALLRWDGAPPPEVTNSMSLKEFGSRPVLPDALAVLFGGQRRPAAHPPSEVRPAPGPPAPRSPAGPARPEIATGSGGSVQDLMQKFNQPRERPSKAERETKQSLRAKEEQRRQMERLRGRPLDNKPPEERR